MSSKYFSKPLSWWLHTPLYASRHLRHWVKRRRAMKSANNEDRIIAALLNRKKGYCVEVGALDGLNGSNTLYFEKRGWKCLLVEADPEMARLCAKNRPRAITISAAAVAPQQSGNVTFQIIKHNRAMSSLSFDEAGRKHFDKYGVNFSTTPVEIEAKTLDAMLEGAKAPLIDFITIDVEGHELEVLQGFDLKRWKPRIIMLERIQKMPDPAITQIMNSHGYKHILTVPLGAVEDCNDFYFKARR